MWTVQRAIAPTKFSRSFNAMAGTCWDVGMMLRRALAEECDL